MNIQQRQRLEQIRKWRNGLTTITVGEKHWIDTIDSLLSLVKSQEASSRNPVGWISCGLRHGHDRIVDIVFENATCAKDFIDGVEPVTGPIIAAEQMRSACVETVKALAESWAKSINDQWDERPDLSFDAGERLKAAGEIITALESVSIQEQKS